MRNCRYFQLTWYLLEGTGKNIIVYDNYPELQGHITELLNSNDCLSFYITTHNTMPKET